MTYLAFSSDHKPHKWARSIVLIWIFAACSTFPMTNVLFAQTQTKPRPSQNFKTVTGQQNRVIKHTEAYTKRNIVGGHVNVKVTPPEKRGVAGKVGVEVYNYSPVYLSLVDFWMELETKAMYKIDSKIKVENLKQNWGDIVWIDIPTQFAKDFPIITSIKITNLKMYDEKSRQVKIPVTTDLIKY